MGGGQGVREVVGGHAQHGGTRGRVHHRRLHVAGGIADEGVSSKRSALGEGNGPGE
jgi:hypothetical protein